MLMLRLCAGRHIIFSRLLLLACGRRCMATTPDSPFFSRYLISPKQLGDALAKPAPASSRIVPLCASWFLPNDGRSGLQTFKEERIPNARFFDLDGVKHRTSPYPHMLPSVEDFAKAMGELGIENKDTVVVYDTQELGIFSAPRVAWTLKVFGHDRVHVLNNFRLWVQQGFPTESGEPGPVEPTVYKTSADHSQRDVIDFETVRSVAQGKSTGNIEGAVVLDARPKGRFDGTAAEPRPGLPSGHMPNSINIPFPDVLDPDTKAVLPGDKLRDLFATKGIKSSGTVINSCGTGVTAAVIDIALAEADHPASRLLYDGSWTEWAQRVTEKDGLIIKS